MLGQDSQIEVMAAMFGQGRHVEAMSAILGQGGTHSPPPGERQAQGAGQGHGHHDDVDRQAGDGGAVSACRSGAWRWWRQEGSESYRKGRGLIGKDGNGQEKVGLMFTKGRDPPNFTGGLHALHRLLRTSPTRTLTT